MFRLFDSKWTPPAAMAPELKKLVHKERIRQRMAVYSLILVIIELGALVLMSMTSPHAATLCVGVITVVTILVTLYYRVKRYKYKGGIVTSRGVMFK